MWPRKVADTVDAAASEDLVGSVVCLDWECARLESIVAGTTEESIVPNIPRDEGVSPPPTEHVVAGLAEEPLVPSLPVQLVVALATLRPGSRGSEPKADQVVERGPLYLNEAQIGVVALDLSSRDRLTASERRDATTRPSRRLTMPSSFRNRIRSTGRSAGARKRM
jgi:hypothetical protein